MTTEPTDAELKAMWQLHAADIGGILDFARAVLAKWGTPAPVGVGPVAYMDVAQSKSKMSMTWWPEPAGFSLPNGRYPLYTTPQPTQPQAVAVPMTDEQVSHVIELFSCGDGKGHDVHGIARTIEAEVRKEDTELIRQLVEALESVDDAMPFPVARQVLKVARARLEGKP